ncbi:BQ2448_3128 [Microbotryum intermedium]|uniref:BQ2448_3128 protein n=1 Tax=Microbotryum intermedium TaxID=269621 RepID=A0A238FCI6_9BASI|nr:BQ2448_3128 [Microbotryum intermedium]
MRSTLFASLLSPITTAYSALFDSGLRIQDDGRLIVLPPPASFSRADAASAAPLGRSQSTNPSRPAAAESVMVTLTPPPAVEDDEEARATYDENDFYDPRIRGGRLLNRVNDWNGEPLNVIISARSSPDVLRESGLIVYSKSLGLWKECLDLHGGGSQYANLGDGEGISSQRHILSTVGENPNLPSHSSLTAGFQPELFVLRQSDWPYVGSCVESVVGGNHFRAWKQNGTQANSGAWFLSASKEMDIRGHHKIIPDGYNIGRDLIVAKAIAGTRYRRRIWTAEVEWIEGLLEPGNQGVNHGIAQDGRIALLTVTEY